MKHEEFYGEKYRPLLALTRRFGAAVEVLAANCSDSEGRRTHYPGLSHASAVVALQGIVFSEHAIAPLRFTRGYYLFEPDDGEPVLCEAVLSPDYENRFVVIFCGESDHHNPSDLEGRFYGPLRFFTPTSSMDLTSIERAWQDKLAANAKKPANENQTR